MLECTLHLQLRTITTGIIMKASQPTHVLRSYFMRRNPAVRHHLTMDAMDMTLVSG